ncbi:MAG: hypothetical protein IM592_13675, partial [Bacteroidetes bacterium]|nr:hypothetical protein [Bacteroidota bacterium]
ESTWLTPVRQARVKIIHQKHLQSLVVTQNKKSPVKDFSAGKRGSLSKPKDIENKALTPNVFSQTDLTRLTEELIKFHEFFKIHFREISAILEKD